MDSMYKCTNGHVRYHPHECGQCIKEAREELPKSIYQRIVGWFDDQAKKREEEINKHGEYSGW